MKSIIVEIKGNFAAVLSDDGCITKIKNKNYVLGQVIELNVTKKPNIRKLISYAAAAAILIIGIGTGTWTYASPYTYVSLDVNPSLVFSLNRYERVLTVKAMNEDGQELLQDKTLPELKHKKIQYALSITINQLEELGYFSDDNGGILLSTYGKDEEKNEDLASKLKENTENDLEQNDESTIVESINADSTLVQEAKEFGITPGKLNLIKKLESSAEDPDSINYTEWLNKPVREILEAINNNKKITDTEENSSEDSAFSKKEQASEEKEYNEAETNDINNKENLSSKDKNEIIKKNGKDTNELNMKDSKAKINNEDNNKKSSKVDTTSDSNENSMDKNNSRLSDNSNKKENEGEKENNTISNQNKFNSERKNNKDSEVSKVINNKNTLDSTEVQTDTNAGKALTEKTNTDKDNENNNKKSQTADDQSKSGVDADKISNEDNINDSSSRTQESNQDKESNQEKESNNGSIQDKESNITENSNNSNGNSWSDKTSSSNDSNSNKNK